MPKRTIDDLLATINSVEILREIVREHGTAIENVLNRLELIERRLAAIEAGSAGTVS